MQLCATMASSILLRCTPWPAPPSSGRDGKAKDAVRLAELALAEVRADDVVEADDDDGAFLFTETLRWARYRLRALLRRQGVKKVTDALDATMALDDVVTLDAKKLLAGADKPSAVADGVTAIVSGAEDKSLADALMSAHCRV